MSILKLAIASLFLFLVCFPKGGIKVGSIPITWGYLLLAFWGLIGLWRNVGRRSLSFSSGFCLAALAPFQCILLAKFLICGWRDVGPMLSLFVSFLILPFFFFFSFPGSFKPEEVSFFNKWLKYSVIFVASFGIFLFVYKLYTAHFVEIPYLTVNVDDVGQLETKNIDRGGIFKLISTYNNGNLYGICLLMILPLFSSLEKRFLPNFLVKASLFLTLSRTVWAGLFVFEVLDLFVFRVSKRSLLHLIFDLGVMALIFCFAFYFLGFQLSFLFDADLGGRRPQFSALSQAALFSRDPFEGIGEISYLGILKEFGVLGLFFFLVSLCAPLAVCKKRACVFGAILYLFVSLSDGALELIPVMAFYWGLIAISLMISSIPKQSRKLDF